VRGDRGMSERRHSVSGEFPTVGSESGSALPDKFMLSGPPFFDLGPKTDQTWHMLVGDLADPSADWCPLDENIRDDPDDGDGRDDDDDDGEGKDDGEDDGDDKEDDEEDPYGVRPSPPDTWKRHGGGGGQG